MTTDYQTLGCATCAHAISRFNGGNGATTCSLLRSRIVSYGKQVPEDRPEDCPLPPLLTSEPMTHSEHHLRAILTLIDDEAQVVEVDPTTSRQHHGYVSALQETETGWERASPTHAVIDIEGDTMGRGLSAEDAIADAIKRAYRHKRDAHMQLREDVQDLRQALTRLGLA